MLKTRILLLAVILLLIPASGALAQDGALPNRFVVPGSDLIIEYPHGWNLSYDTEDGSIYLSSTVTGIVTDWLFADELAQVGIAPGDAVAALEYFFNPLDPSVPFDAARVSNQLVDGKRLYVYQYQDIFEGAPYDGVLVALEASDGSFFSGDIFGLETADVDPADVRDALRIVASVQFPGDSTAPPPVVADDLFWMFNSGIGVVVPDGWRDYVDEDGFLTFESVVSIMEPHWYFADELPSLGIARGDVPGVLEDMADLFGLPFDPANVSVSQVSGRSVWHTMYAIEEDAGTYETLLAAVLLDNGAVLVGLAYPAIDSELTEREDVLELLASAQSGESVPAGADTLLSESFTFEPDGVTFYYPASWEISTDEEFVYMVSDFTFADPFYTLVEDLAGQGVAIGDLTGGLESLWHSLYDSEGLFFDPAALETLTIGGQTVMLYRFEHDSGDGVHDHWMTAVELEDGTQFYLDTYPIQGSALQESDVVLDIAASAAIELNVPISGDKRIAIRLNVGD